MGQGHAAFADLFAELLATRSPSPKTVRAAFDAILSGAWTPVQVGAFAASLRVLGEPAEAIVAAAEALRATMHVVDHGETAVLDTCGTGGDGSHTLNLSTAAAIALASCGLKVAKHGNRSVSSRCGSADVMEALGIPLGIPPERQADVLREANIAFLFAPAHHPALKHAGEARRELGVRTIFNIIGPLVNPARATHQLVGVFDDALRPIMARALSHLGVRRAWVVRSEDGLDEISPGAPTRVSVLEDGNVFENVVSPEDFGVRPLSLAVIAGGTAADNARALEAILRGEAHPAREAVVLNVAAALLVAGAESAPKAAAERAREALTSGAAARTLDTFRVVAQKVHNK